MNMLTCNIYRLSTCLCTDSVPRRKKKYFPPTTHDLDKISIVDLLYTEFLLMIYGTCTVILDYILERKVLILVKSVLQYRFVYNITIM